MKEKINKILQRANIKITEKITLGLVLFVILIALFSQQWILQNNFQKTKKQTYNQINSLEKKIVGIEDILQTAQKENIDLIAEFEATKEKAESLENQFDKVSDNVDDLEKIATTDPELLQKYSKIYFLNEHYVPEDLKTIPSEFTYNQARKYEIHDEVWPYLKDLLEDAEDDGVSLLIISAFRSFSTQATLKGAYVVTYGAGTANQFSAEQGYSEHQLGTAVDFTTPTVGATFSGFAQTAEYTWLLDNAHKYGFIISYPQNNGAYQFEPWHWRFVGKRLAKDLYKHNQYFYDRAQRDIDEFIIYLFD